MSCQLLVYPNQVLQTGTIPVSSVVGMDAQERAMQKTLQSIASARSSEDEMQRALSIKQTLELMEIAASALNEADPDKYNIEMRSKTNSAIEKLKAAELHMRISSLADNISRLEEKLENGDEDEEGVFDELRAHLDKLKLQRELSKLTQLRDTYQKLRRERQPSAQ